MSLYNHVPSKSALLDGVAEAVIAGIELAVPPGAGWQEQLRAQARAFRHVAMAHPRCTMIVVSRPPSSRQHGAAGGERAGHAAGGRIRGQDAVRIVRAFVAYIMGSLLREASVAASLADPDGAAERHRSVRKATDSRQVAGLAADLLEPDTDADFEFGLDLLARAIAALQPTPAGR